MKATVTWARVIDAYISLAFASPFTASSVPAKAEVSNQETSVQ